MSFICSARTKVVKKRKEDDEFGRLLLRLVPASVHFRAETRIRNYVTASPYQIRRNSGNGTTPNKTEIRSLRQINLWSLHGILQGGRLRGVSGWARMCPVSRTGERFPTLGTIPFASARGLSDELRFTLTVYFPQRPDILRHYY